MKKTVLKCTSVLLTIVMLFSLTLAAAAYEEGVPFENSSYYTQGDYVIHYRVVEAQGEYKGRILFIHGFVSSTVTWEPMSEILSAQGYECVLADLPNFGYSTRESADISEIEREDLMVGLMQSIAPIDEWIIGGHSMGGGVALNIAQQNPEIQGLLLYCPAASVGTPLSTMSFLPFSTLEVFMNNLVKLMISFNSIVRMLLGFASMDVPFTLSYDLSRITDPLAVENTGSGILNMTQRSASVDLEAIGQLEMPILLIWANNELVISASMMQELSDALPQAQSYTLAGGHMIIESNPELLAQVTYNFINQ